MTPELISAALSSLWISSPILVIVALSLAYFMRSYLDRKFEIYRDSAIEKIRHENLTIAAEMQHRLSIGFDKVKIIHENQKDAVAQVFAALSDAVSECRSAYSYEKERHPLFPQSRLKEVKEKVHRNGLFVERNAFQIASLILDILGRNSDWIYDAVGPDEGYSFSEFDLNLLDCLLGLLFVALRNQIGIEEVTVDVIEVEEWSKISELSSFPISWTIFGLSAVFSGNADVAKTREYIFHNEGTRVKVIAALRSTIRGASDIPRIRENMERVLEYLEKVENGPGDTIF